MGLHETSFFLYKECVISQPLQYTDVPLGRSNINLNNVDASNAQICRVTAVVSEYHRALATKLRGLLNVYLPSHLMNHWTLIAKTCFLLRPTEASRELVVICA